MHGIGCGQWSVVSGQVVSGQWSVAVVKLAAMLRIAGAPKSSAPLYRHDLEPIGKGLTPEANAR